jgi:chromosome segregation ATPase
MQHDTQRIVAAQQCRLGRYAKEATDLNQEISRMAQENGVVHQQVRDLESRLHNKDEALLNSYRRSSKHDQELLRHRVLLRMAEEVAVVKARELEEFQATKDQEIENLQEQLEKCEEEVQERKFELLNRDNEIDNLLAQIHKLQLQQALAPVTPAEDPAPSSDVEDLFSCTS